MNRKKSFYKKMLNTFLIMLILFLLCSLALFLWSSSVIDKQVKRSINTEFLLFTKKCDNSFDSIFDSAIGIKDYLINHYTNTIKSDENGICDFIASQQNVLDEVAEIFVFEDGGNVYTKDGVFDAETIYYSFYDVGGQSFEEWRECITSYKDNTVGKISLSTILSSNHIQMRAIEYCKYYEINRHPFLIVYDIDMGKFFGDKYKNGSYGIMFQDDKVYPEDELMISAKDIVSSYKDGNISFRHKNTKYSMNIAASNTYNCRYIFIQPCLIFSFEVQ